MGKRSQIKASRKIGGALVRFARTVPATTLSAQRWRKDLLVSWLFQTCITLQTSLNRRFLRFGMTLQKASLLLRCVEARRISPGQLAVALGRDKGKITRYIDSLESRRLLVREIDQRDRRFSILKPTAMGKRVAQELALVFDNIRKELFAGILESDVRRLSQTLARLHKNAVRIGTRRRKRQLQERYRIGSYRVRSQGKEMSQPQVAAEVLKHSSKGRTANTVAVEFM